MIIYSKGLDMPNKPHSVIYRNIVLKVGGIMKDKNIFYNESNDKELFEGIAYIFMLDRLVDKKTKEFMNYSKNNKSFLSKYNWINKWQLTTKRERMENIYNSFRFNTIDKKNYQIPKLLFQCYTRYFDVINEEKNKKAKYEEMFNTIIQIPIEICEALEIHEKVTMKAKFLNNKYKERDNYSDIYFCNDECYPLVV